MVPDVPSVLGAAEQPGRLREPLPALPLTIRSHFGEKRAAAKVGGGVGSVLVEARGGEQTSRRPVEEEEGGCSDC